MKQITFNHAYLTKIDIRDLMNCVAMITDYCNKFTHGSVVFVNSFTVTDCPDNKLMTTVKISFQVFNNDDNKEEKLTYKTYRAKDYTCSNSLIETRDI